MKELSRREFLRYLGLGTVGLIVKPRFNFTNSSGSRASDVVQCFHENATSGSTINESVVQIMVDESIKALTGIGDVGEAWKSVFPGIHEASVIGIKVNCLCQITTHREFVNCLVTSLTQMQFSGIPYVRNNVIIWDNYDSLLMGNGGYTIYDGDDPDTVRCFGTNHSGVGYDALEFNVHGVSSNPSSIMTVLCDYIINAAVIKDHSIAQITLTMKNNYGSIHNPGSLHGGQCNPYIPSLNQQIRDVITPNNKQSIFIVDALIGCYSGGPGGSPNFNPKMVLMSFDSVACDYQGQNLINEERANHGLYQYNAPHIITATQPPYNLGTTDINLIEINNPHAGELKKVIPEDSILKIQPNPFYRNTMIILFLVQTSMVHLDLVDTVGRTVIRIYSGELANGTHRIPLHISENLSSGTYLTRLDHNGKTTIKKIVVLH